MQAAVDTLVSDRFTHAVTWLGTTDDTIELAKFGRDAVGKTFNGTPLVAVAIVYLVITIPLTRVAAYLEKRAKRGR